VDNGLDCRSAINVVLLRTETLRRQSGCEWDYKGRIYPQGQEGEQSKDNGARRCAYGRNGNDEARWLVNFDISASQQAGVLGVSGMRALWRSLYSVIVSLNHLEVLYLVSRMLVMKSRNMKSSNCTLVGK
jgi:hypothetical protein